MARAECAGWVQLAVFLLHAADAGDPEWGAYLDEAQKSQQLPPVLWSEEVIQELKGTQVAETVMQYRCEHETLTHRSQAAVLEATLPIIRVATHLRGRYLRGL